MVWASRLRLLSATLLAVAYGFPLYQDVRPGGVVHGGGDAWLTYFWALPVCALALRVSRDWAHRTLDLLVILGDADHLVLIESWRRARTTRRRIWALLIPLLVGCDPFSTTGSFLEPVLLGYDSVYIADADGTVLRICRPTDAGKNIFDVENSWDFREPSSRVYKDRFRILDGDLQPGTSG